MENKRFCSRCGVEITDAKAKKCASCGANIKQRKPVYKIWWFWVIMGVCSFVMFAAIGSSGDDPSSTGEETENDATTTAAVDSNNGDSSKKYEVVDLQKMIDDLDENALRAENTYQNKYVQVIGKISSFDSDGYYIRIEPEHADKWNYDTVTCYVKNDNQREFLMEKAVGDTVTIKGKIISIGEYIGYYMNIEEIS